jgi:hypothetical protein
MVPLDRFSKRYFSAHTFSIPACEAQFGGCLNVWFWPVAVIHITEIHAR